MLVRNYVRRLRMEAPVRSPLWPDVPAGFTLVAWHPDLLPAHAEVKFRAFRHTLDAAIFPNLGVLDGCLQLMRTIAGHDGFVPEATWLVRGPDGGVRYVPEGGKGAGEAEPSGRPATASDGEETQLHMQNFLDCVRSRKQPNATVEQGHYGAMACHMGNFAWKEKRVVPWREEWDV